MLLNTWVELNSWREDIVVTPPGDCIPWIGSSWVADCVEQHYTLSWVCCEGQVVPDAGPQPGGGSSKKPWVRAPGRGNTYKLAQYEDEEIIAVLQAILASRRKN